MALGILADNHADQALAEAQYPALLPLKGTLDISGVIGMDRLLGLLAHVMDKLDMANGHYEDALGFCRKGGYRPELAWTCCDYADTLLKRNGESDRIKAMSLLDESLAISSELGMRPLMERVLSRREILGA